MTKPTLRQTLLAILHLPPVGCAEAVVIAQKAFERRGCGEYGVIRVRYDLTRWRVRRHEPNIRSGGLVVCVDARTGEVLSESMSATDEVPVDADAET